MLAIFAFYLVRVRTARSNFSEKLPIIPGMTAEVDILTGHKTVMSYLLKPVVVDKSNWEKVLVDGGYYKKSQIN